MKRIKIWTGPLAVLMVFLLGLGLRLLDLDDAPLDFHPTRQLHAALIARGMFYEDRTGLPAWKQALAVRQWHAEGQIEPPVMETLAMWGYRLAGGAYLWIPRLLAIAFWMVGAILLYRLMRRMTGRMGALAAAGFFLFLPYGVIASRSFQPEALQTAAIIATLWAAFRWQDLRAEPSASERSASPALRWAILTGVLAGLAIYVKLTSIFLLGPVLVVLALQAGRDGVPLRRLPGRLLRDRQLWLLAILALLPALLYHLDGFFISGFLQGQTAGRFYPHMWLDPAFYLRWVRVLERLMPFSLVMTGLAGNLLAGERRRPALLAFWAGYGLYGLVLPFHISTHDYYHLVLLIPVSMGLGSIAGLIYSHLPNGKSLARGLALAALCAGLVITVYNVRTVLKRQEFRAEAALWRDVGIWLGPQSETVALVDDYGGRLKYWGWVMPLIWPTADDQNFMIENGNTFDFASRFEDAVADRDYFLISPISELESQPELAQALSQYLVIYQASDPNNGRTIRIYRLRSSP